MVDVAGSYGEARLALRALLPQPVLNWREARFYGRYGEVELHLLEFLCKSDGVSIDVGANDGSYVHYMRRYSRHVVAYEPQPALVRELRRKFQRGVTVEDIALSDTTGTLDLLMPVVDGVTVTGCSTISGEAASTYPGWRSIEVRPYATGQSYGQLARTRSRCVAAHFSTPGRRSRTPRGRPAHARPLPRGAAPID
jgi:hypothetical protein